MEHLPDMVKLENNQMKVELKRKTKQFRRILVVFFLIITLVAVIVSCSFSYYNFRKILTRKIAQYTLDGLNQTVVNVQLKLAEFENISLRLFINKDFNSNLANYVSGDAPQSNIKEYFNEHMISNKDIFAFMFICDSQPEKSLVITKDYHNEFVDLTQYFNNTSSYRKIVNAGGGIVWSNTIKLNRNNFVILGRYINDLNSGLPLGILAIAVDEDKIDQLTNLTVYNRLHISINELENYSFIINNDGDIISSPFKEEIGENVSKIMEDIELLKPILAPSVSDRDYGNEINQGSFITQVNRKRTLVTYKAIGSKIGVGGRSGWNILNLTTATLLYEEQGTMPITIIILSFCLGVVAIVLAYYATKLISKIRLD